MSLGTFLECRTKLKEERGVIIPIPAYYLNIPDDSILTPDTISKLFDRHVKRVRAWFNPGLEFGRLESISPTRYQCTGWMLKEFFWNKDWIKVFNTKVGPYKVMDWLTLCSIDHEQSL